MEIIEETESKDNVKVLVNKPWCCSEEVAQQRSQSRFV